MAVKAKHDNLEIARFLKVTTSSVCKVRKELPNENNGVELTTTRERKQEHCQRSARSLTKSQFVVPIFADGDNRSEMTEEEKAKRREFERKRKEVATPGGLDIKAVLGRRVSIPNTEDEDEDDADDEYETKETSDSNQKTDSINPQLKNPQDLQKYEKK
ncbi:hypothetical protein ACTXT7_004268 [Hymenolepis weldensis]